MSIIEMAFLILAGSISGGLIGSAIVIFLIRDRD